MRYYSTTAGEMVLQAAISSSDTMLTVDTTGGLPVTYPYTLILDYGTASEEVVDVTGAAGTTLTVARAKDGTIATSHEIGAKIRHGVTARDFRESREHEAATGAHGVATVVGTSETQSLRNKTFTPTDDTTPITVVERAGNTTPVLAWKDGSSNVMARWVNQAAEWLDGTNVVARIRTGAGAATAKEVLGLRVANDIHALVGSKVAGATGKFLRLLDTDGTTELFSVGADGAVASKGITATGDVTASGNVSGTNITTLTTTQASHTTTLADHESRITTNHADISTNAVNVNDLNVNRITPAENHLAKLPLAEDAGQASVPAGGSVAITFAVGRFTAAPRVTLGIVSNSMPASVVGAYHSVPTTTGCTIYVNSSAALSGGAATVDWHAVQMS